MPRVPIYAVPMTSESHRDLPEIKRGLRRTLVDARTSLSAEELAARSAALTANVLRVVTPGSTVAAYHPLGTEPGVGTLLEALRTVADTIWLPISGPDNELLWAVDAGDEDTAAGQLGVREPTGQRYNWHALTECDLVLVPALGVNPAGVRIGKGAGYYDRALAHLYTRAERPRVAVLLFDGEIRADIPAEAHDMPVDLIITDAGITAPRNDG
ncbi:putative 5-formyltetrahydrofolate cyclo-ligase [Corynebacterium guangdongense]|nr:putative 5-formyltetrahydrofolate cyclo-ligase [Corynebacterium guangdongense]